MSKRHRLRHEPIFLAWVRDRIVELIEVTSAAVQLGGQKPHQRQPRPLSEPERSEKLVTRMLQRRLNAVYRGNRQSITSLLTPQRYRVATGLVNKDDLPRQ